MVEYPGCFSQNDSYSFFGLATGQQGEDAIRWMRNHLDYDQCGAQRLCVEESRQPSS